MLEYSDLRALIVKGVEEGLFVEYKSEFPTPVKIAKSISSFANAYGGWYIVGVRANKKNNIAEELVGISSGDHFSVIRDSAKAHLSPCPDFRVRIIQEGSKDFVVVRISDGQEKPIVCSDGRIYRRQGDSSDPVHENQRHIVDQMYREGESYKDAFKKFCESGLTHPHGREDLPFLKVSLAPRNEIWKELPYDHTGLVKFREMLGRTVRIQGNHVPGVVDVSIPFDRVQSGLGCVTVFQGTSNWISAAMTLYDDGRAQGWLPLPKPDWDLVKNKALPQNRDIDEARKGGKLIEIGKLTLTTALIITKYVNWIGKEDVRIAFELGGVLGLSPIYFSMGFHRLVQSAGLPIVRENNICWPNNSKGYFLYEPTNSELTLWETVCSHVVSALGPTVEGYLEAVEDLLGRHALPAETEHC